MINAKIHVNKRLEPAEKFFVEKSLELLSAKTIDTYRLRLHNPKSILQELVNVIEAVSNKTLKRSYAEVLCEEAISLLNIENELTFKTVHKGYLMQVLSRKDIISILYTCTLLLKDNENYIDVLWEKVRSEIIRITTLPAIHADGYVLLDRLIHYFYIELKKQGYNKQYLYNTIVAIFGGSDPMPDFNHPINIIASLIRKSRERFSIYFGFNFTGIAEKLLKLDSFEMVPIALLLALWPLKKAKPRTLAINSMVTFKVTKKLTKPS